MPRVTSRLGIDQHPVSLSDPDARAWLEAFIWPEDVAGLAVLRSAIGFAASGTGVIVVKGDATTDTARLLAELPGHEPVVVFTASLLSYLTTEARTAFVGQLELLALADPYLRWLAPAGAAADDFQWVSQEASGSG